VIGWVAGLALLLPLVSALTSPAVPLPFRFFLVALWVLARTRPHHAIAALAVLVPIASWLLLASDAPPIRYAEALVLATLSGALMAAARPRRTPLEGGRPGLGVPAALFTAIVCASAGVMLEVMQAGTHAPWPFIRSFLIFLTRDYLVGPPGAFVGVADAALLVEGIGLMFLVARHARDHVVRPAELFTAAALSGVVAAVVTLNTFVLTALHAVTVREFLWRLAFSRMGVHVEDVNAAGSFFAMTTLLAVAHAMNNRHARGSRHPLASRALWIAAAALMAAAMWISGSRMALAATVGGLGVLAAAARPLRISIWPRWAIVTAAACAALVIVAVVLGLDPRPSASRTASRMLTMRADFMITGLRMIASAPLLGVGIGRYYEMSGQFMPASIYWFYFNENAHNNFLQIAGELGLAGLAAFVWLLGAAAIRIVRGLRADAGDRRLLGAAVALGAFVATWMTSHPMLVAEVAFPFWMLLGAAIARADGNARPPLHDTRFGESGSPLAASPDAHPKRTNSVRGAGAIVGAIIVALAVSVPLRARQRMATIDFGRFSFGFYEWEGGPELRFRWTTRRATFFIPLSARQLQLQLRAIHLGSNTAPTEVSIAIGGRTFHRVLLANDDWTTVSLRLPLLPEDENYQRIDIITEPTWSPAALFGGRSDVRVLGVQVAEPVTAP
jgi:O-antigen ligase